MRGFLFIVFCLSTIIGFSNEAEVVGNAETNITEVATDVGTNAVEVVQNRQAKITAANTYYDRKEGVAIFSGNVFVDDEEYKLHADKAFVFMETEEGINRIVAMGNVAMTNGTKRAYGDKVSYHRKNGMVVLYAGDGITAEVRDEVKKDHQSVRGSKIKFWIDSEQVEVVDAEISAPVDLSNMKKTGGKLL